MKTLNVVSIFRKGKTYRDKISGAHAARFNNRTSDGGRTGCNGKKSRTHSKRRTKRGLQKRSAK